MIIFLTLDHCHYKSDANSENPLKLFSVVANYRLLLGVKTNYEMVFVLKISFSTPGVVFKFQCGFCN